MSEPWVLHHKIHPILSNLLPEGSTRELIAQNIKVHAGQEFDIFSCLGKDLPGALVAEPIESKDIPQNILTKQEKEKASSLKKYRLTNKFSLAGGYSHDLDQQFA